MTTLADRISVRQERGATEARPSYGLLLTVLACLALLQAYITWYMFTFGALRGPFRGMIA